MSGNEYQRLALRTAGDGDIKYLIENGVMGLNGEAGECIDIVKKWRFQGHPLDSKKLKDELGDVLWYVAITAAAIGCELNDVMQHNIDKLRKRYPEGLTLNAVCIVRERAAAREAIMGSGVRGGNNG